MIKKQYSGSARRARNIIWNAAGRYDFEPLFMAFFPNGDPDHYFNMIAGLVQKWLDMPRLWDFFALYETDRRADEFDDLLQRGYAPRWHAPPHPDPGRRWRRRSACGPVSPAP